MFAFIHWDVDPELFRVGEFAIRYYGLLFSTAIVAGYFTLNHLFKNEGLPENETERLSLYLLVGTVVGARLGHTLFYQPGVYLADPVKILEVWKGGLASHGAAFGLVAASYLFHKKRKRESYLWLVDRLVVAVTAGIGFVRIGNLMNSEIVGAPTDAAWAFIFERVDMIPRHPSQLYEAIAYFAIFGVLFYLYKKRREKFHDGFLIGLGLALIFTFRFLVELVKANQVDFESGMIVNMGQILSLPFIATGVWLFTRALIAERKANANTGD